MSSTLTYFGSWLVMTCKLFNIIFYIHELKKYWKNDSYECIYLYIYIYKKVCQ